MRVVSLAPCTCDKAGTSIALGMFDGVHIGHRRIILAAKNKSTETGVPTSVLLFSKSPHGAAELLPLEDRLCELEKLGVNFVYIYDFEEICSKSPEEFVGGELHDKIGAKAAFAGYNYRFGAGAKGDSEMLIELCKKYSMDCGISTRVDMLGDSVSSTRIRKLLESGDVVTANELLGFPYYLRAEVVHGKELGRKLGLPTINQKFGEKRVRMAHGIYYTKTTIDGKTYLSVSNVGIRPTVEETEVVNLETHILDFDGDVYGKVAKVEFFGKGREECRFDSVEELRQRISLDCELARKFFDR